MIIIPIIIVIISLVGYLISQQQKQKYVQSEQSKEQILTYISENNGQEFDYDYVSEQFGISLKQIYKYLYQLEKEDKIVSQQKYLRKPILLSDNDYENYFWKVFIKSEEHSQSNLGANNNSNFYQN